MERSLEYITVEPGLVVRGEGNAFVMDGTVSHLWPAQALHVDASKMHSAKLTSATRRVSEPVPPLSSILLISGALSKYVDPDAQFTVKARDCVVLKTRLLQEHVKAFPESFIHPYAQVLTIDKTGTRLLDALKSMPPLTLADVVANVARIASGLLLAETYHDLRGHKFGLYHNALSPDVILCDSAKQWRLMHFRGLRHWKSISAGLAHQGLSCHEDLSFFQHFRTARITAKRQLGDGKRSEHEVRATMYNILKNTPSFGSTLQERVKVLKAWVKRGYLCEPAMKEAAPSRVIQKEILSYKLIQIILSNRNDVSCLGKVVQDVLHTVSDLQTSPLATHFDTLLRGMLEPDFNARFSLADCVSFIKEHMKSGHHF